MGETAELPSSGGDEASSAAADVENGLIGEENNKDAEVVPALISVHPFEKSVVVAVGCELRVFDLEDGCSVSLIDNSGGSSHSDAIRAIKFGGNGRLFASAGDDKLVKIWATNPWHCIQTVSAEKRVSSVAVSHNGQYVAFADKFGFIWLIGLREDAAQQSKIDDRAVLIIGHYCSIITRLEFSPDDRFIASADRDFKIRISMFPKQPMKGSYEIQSFCLGHTNFVSSLAFVCPSGYTHGFILSGSGDSTVRLWDFTSGVLITTCKVGEKVGLLQSNGMEDGSSAVADLCVSTDGSLIVAALQSLHGVALLSCDYSCGNLSIVKVVTLEENYFPTSFGLSSLKQHLWMAMGVSNLPTLGSANAKLPIRLRIMSGLCKDPSDCHDHDPILLGDDQVPGGLKLLSELQGSLDAAEKEATLAAAVKVSRRNMMMIKKEYTLEKREMRKRNRNDKKLR